MSSRMHEIAVIGTGSWGTALAFTAAHKAGRVTLRGRDRVECRSIMASRRNTRYLPDCELPDNVLVTASVQETASADAILFVVPSRALRQVAEEMRTAEAVKPGAVLISCAKGIESGTGLRMSEILHGIFPENPVAVLSGPNHAEEIGRRLAAAAVIGSHDEEVSVRVQQFFTLPWFRTYRSTDVAGIEWGGAAKNIFAIASGICEGLGLGDNARAALVTRSLVELARLGQAAGGRFETFQGLSGVGDLVVTCYSSHSRNHRVGRLLGAGQSLEEITAGMNMVAEGVPNTESIYTAARAFGVRTPIIDVVYAVLYQEKSCSSALTELLSRDPRAEAD
ncbi:MAG: NAD(P)-dependent glycerol-3-phosphate dehydrogenase [Verrucomicrobiales bacterium]|nr:NAD(P)-dependent glycerol-3-phosphate dehydrogenase [Verrucomicrobiales bacterium]